MTIKKIISNLILVVCFVAICVSTFQIFKSQMDLRKIKADNQTITDLIDDQVGDGDTTKPFVFTSQKFNELYKINEDFVFYLHFQNRLISIPVVQYKDNDYYLTRTFKKGKGPQGAIFMSYENSFAHDNVVVYGHNMFGSSTLMFTPLTKLMKQKGFDDNKLFDIYFENKFTTYEVLYVYEFNIKDYPNYDFTQTVFYNQVDFDNFIAYAKKHSKVKTNSSAKFGDKLMTMQTCLSSSEDLRLIVVSKQIDTGLLAEKQ